MYDYDVVYLGSGHSCWHGAATLAAAGRRVALVDGDLPGGTCTNYGCDAKILLDGPFEFLEGLERYRDLCVVGDVAIDWSRLMAYKKAHFAPFPQLMTGMFDALGLTFVPQFGRLVDAHTVRAGDVTLTCERVVIGTGQRDAVLDIPGRELLHTSRELLDLDQMPDRIVFVGAGIISMEFASMALILGKEVTIVEFAPRALAAYPKKYVDKLVAKVASQGATFRFGEGVSSVVEVADGYQVVTSAGCEIACDYVLCGAGRVCNVEGLGLEELGIQASRRGIVVDDHLRTSVPTIYASGDVVDKDVPRLTPTAEFESNYIADQILGVSDAPICYPPVPNLVFTLPLIAQVGVTVDEAAGKPEAYRVVEIPYGVRNEWVDNRELDIELTLIVDTTGHLADALYGSEGGTWIDFLTQVINDRLTGADLRARIFAFPTQTYMLASTLATLLV